MGIGKGTAEAGWRLPTPVRVRTGSSNSPQITTLTTTPSGSSSVRTGLGTTRLGRHRQTVRLVKDRGGLPWQIPSTSQPLRNCVRTSLKCEVCPCKVKKRRKKGVAVQAGTYTSTPTMCCKYYATLQYPVLWYLLQLIRTAMYREYWSQRQPVVCTVGFW